MAPEVRNMFHGLAKRVGVHRTRVDAYNLSKFPQTFPGLYRSKHVRVNLASHHVTHAGIAVFWYYGGASSARSTKFMPDAAENTCARRSGMMYARKSP